MGQAWLPWAVQAAAVAEMPSALGAAAPAVAASSFWLPLPLAAQLLQCLRDTATTNDLNTLIRLNSAHRAKQPE